MFRVPCALRVVVPVLYCVLYYTLLYCTVLMFRVPCALRVVVPGHDEAGPLQQHPAEQHRRPPPAHHRQVGHNITRAANGHFVKV